MMGSQKLAKAGCFVFGLRPQTQQPALKYLTHFIEYSL